MQGDKLIERKRQNLSQTLTDTHQDSGGSCRDSKYEQYAVKISKSKDKEQNRASYGIRAREMERGGRADRRTGKNSLAHQGTREVVKEGENPSANEEGGQKQADCGREGKRGLGGELWEHGWAKADSP